MLLYNQFFRSFFEFLLLIQVNPLVIEWLFFGILPNFDKIYIMYPKGDEQGKNITSITIALKTRVPGESTQESWQFFFYVSKINKEYDY